jgi:Hemolysin-coregulated protein (uncharacterized)
MALTDYFLKVDDIPGESHDEKHKDEIELESWGWRSEQQGGSAVGGGAGVGKVRMQDFWVKMKTNKATAKLGLACWNGKPIPKVVLTCRKPGEEQQEFCKVTLTNSVITSQSISGKEGDTHPADECSFNFEQIEIEYSPQKEDGKLDSPVTAGWNVKKNVKV